MHHLQTYALQEDKSTDSMQGNTTVGFWELDLKSNQFYWSDQLCQILNCAPLQDEATFDKFMSFIHPDDVTMFRQAYDSAIRQKQSISFKHFFTVG